MDGIGVESDIVDVKADTTHVLVSEDTLLASPLESSDNAVLDLVEVLHTLGNIDNDVGASALWAEAPDLTGITDLPVVVVSEVASALLHLLLGRDLLVINVVGEAIGERHGLHEQTVVLVGGLGEAHDA